MTRSDTLRALAASARASHVGALFLVGWFAAAASQEDLDGALKAVEDAAEAWEPDGHLAAYAERWGRLPDRRA